jgi:hypothetical protein
MACKILLTTTVGWPSVARMAGGFAAASCVVDVLSPSGTPVTLSRYIRTHHAYRPLSPISSLAAAIDASQPDLVVACDDRSVRHLLQAYKNLRAREGHASPVAALIERSFGKPENFAAMMSRDGFIATAREMGIRAPETIRVATEAELDSRLESVGLPAVLKSDGSWGGEGVIVVRSREEAHAAFRRLANPPSRVRSLVRALRRRDTHYLTAAIAPSRQTISIQRFVPGHPAASAFACWKGEVVGAIYYDVLVADGIIGPPNVIKRVDCPEIDEATRKIARRFGLSGIHGMDFIRDTSGAVHLIEINPRATQGGTLAFGKGRDLPAALAACIAPAAGMRPAIPNDLVALFPREWQRDPASPYLESGFHDVPWDDPAVLLAALGVSSSKAAARRLEPAPNTAKASNAASLPHPAVAST